MKQNLFLDFKNVEIKQQNKIILNDVNLKINQGEFVYFVGKTGSGKSSLLKWDNVPNKQFLFKS